MCWGGVSSPKPPKPSEPLKTIDDASTKADTEQRRRMLLAKGLESTWTRSQMAGANPASAGSAKANNLGATK